jgi:hypothetical protein
VGFAPLLAAIYSLELSTRRYRIVDKATKHLLIHNL